jgi:hypothetical protein
MGRFRDWLRGQPDNTHSIWRSMFMRGKLGITSIAVVFAVFSFVSMGKGREAQAQRTKSDQHAFEYKVVVLSFNPGERLTDVQRARQFENLLNAEAKTGWEPVTSLLSRTAVQTIGGGVATRDSTSFVAFRRPR